MFRARVKNRFDSWGVSGDLEITGIPSESSRPPPPYTFRSRLFSWNSFVGFSSKSLSMQFGCRSTWHRISRKISSTNFHATERYDEFLFQNFKIPKTLKTSFLRLLRENISFDVIFFEMENMWKIFFSKSYRKRHQVPPNLFCTSLGSFMERPSLHARPECQRPLASVKCHRIPLRITTQVIHTKIHFPWNLCPPIFVETMHGRG